jgi:ribose transport system permease protein
MNRSKKSGAIRPGDLLKRIPELRKKPQFLSFAIMAILMFVLLFFSSDYFSFYNLTTKLRTMLPLMFVAVGQTIVVFGGGIDLSVGSLIALVTVIAVRILTESGATAGGIVLAVSAALAAGVLAGLITGSIVSFLRLSPLISTYAVQVVWGGLALKVMPEPGGDVPFSFYEIYSGNLLIIPVAVLILIMLALVAKFLNASGYSTHVKACGGNLSGAYESVLPVSRLKVGSYVLCGLFSAVAALLIISETTTGNPLSGASYDLSPRERRGLGGNLPGRGIRGIRRLHHGRSSSETRGRSHSFAGLPVNYQVLMQGLIIIVALAAGNILMKSKVRA